MSKEQTRSNTPITAEEFCKELGIYPMDSNELCLDNTANQTQIKKINLCDLLETFAQAKVLEALEKERGEQTKLFNNWVKETFNWVDSDVKRYCRMAWFASAKANGIKQK